LTYKSTDTWRISNVFYIYLHIEMPLCCLFGMTLF